MTKGRIAFQGELGANSHEACVAAFPDMEPVPHAAFEEAFDAVKAGDCQLGMTPPRPLQIWPWISAREEP